MKTLNPEDVARRMLLAGPVRRHIPPELVLSLVNRVEPFIRREPTLLRLRPPLYVIGDLHGQYSDLLRVFQVSFCLFHFLC